MRKDVGIAGLTANAARIMEQEEATMKESKTQDIQGVEPMRDDELEAAVGGAGDSGITPEKAKQTAVRDGRPDQLDGQMANMLCACDNAYKFCKKKPLYLRDGRTLTGYDVSKMKCYKCGATSPAGMRG